MSITTQQNNMSNYLVPASGGTHAVTVKGEFSASPYALDWRNYAVNNFPFSPQGAFIDNSLGTGDLTIVILPLGWPVVVPAGVAQQVQFPAPNGQTCEITGNGQATIIFVDFPVLPSGTASTINGGTVDVGNVVTVNLPVSNAGNPYQVQNIPNAGTPEYLSIAAGATTASVAAPAGLYLRAASLSINGASLGAAALDAVTLTLNGITIAKVTPYIPAVAGSPFNAVFDFSAAPLVSAGNLVVSIGSSLVTGVVELNALFG